MWHVNTVMGARNRAVVDADGIRHIVRLYADGWQFAGRTGMDIWAAAALLNHLRAVLVPQEDGR